jgi:hypothetical protein
MTGATHYRWNDLPKETLKPDLGRRLITTERMMIAQVYLEAGCVVPQHSHENEQLTYVLEGALRLWLGEDDAEELFHTARRRSRTRSTWTCSARRAPTGSTDRTHTYASSDASRSTPSSISDSSTMLNESRTFSTPRPSG